MLEEVKKDVKDSKEMREETGGKRSREQVEACARKENMEEGEVIQGSWLMNETEIDLEKSWKS